MHFYSMDFEKVLNLPIRVFWLLSKNIQRIQARQDLRTLNINTAVALGSNGINANSIGTMRDQLSDELGVFIKVSNNPMDAQLDRDGLNALRNMASKA